MWTHKLPQCRPIPPTAYVTHVAAPTAGAKIASSYHHSKPPRRERPQNVRLSPSPLHTHTTTCVAIPLQKPHRECLERMCICTLACFGPNWGALVNPRLRHATTTFHPPLSPPIHSHPLTPPSGWMRGNRYTLHEYDPRAKSTCRVIGFIKVGEKKLFLYDTAGKMHEVTPTCVLDFYVHESCQRCGFGKELFDHMVAAEGLEPHELAIDKPSPKFSAFLGKHFNLHDVVRQTNNYMVFAAFFRGGPPRKGAGATSGAARSAQGSRSHSRQSASSSKRSDLGVADRKPLNPNSLPTRQTAPAPTSRQPPRSTPRISSISFG